MQRRVTAPGRRLEVQQCLRGAAQFCFCIEGTLGGLHCYFLVCVGCEGGSGLLGFFCFDFCFGIGYLCVLEGCGGGFQETGDFEQAELCVLPLSGQTEIDGVPVDFGFLARPLGDPLILAAALEFPGGVAVGGRRGHMGCVGYESVKLLTLDLVGGARLRPDTGGMSARCSRRWLPSSTCSWR